MKLKKSAYKKLRSCDFHHLKGEIRALQASGDTLTAQKQAGTRFNTSAQRSASADAQGHPHSIAPSGDSSCLSLSGDISKTGAGASSAVSGKTPMWEKQTQQSCQPWSPAQGLSYALGTPWKYRFMKTGGLFQ